MIARRATEVAVVFQPRENCLWSCGGDGGEGLVDMKGVERKRKDVDTYTIVQVNVMRSSYVVKNGFLGTSGGDMPKVDLGSSKQLSC